MKWDEYISEIELIEKQNNTEYDLYTAISNVLKERKALKKFSLRFVGNQTRTKITKLFWGLRGFPDFVVLDKDFAPTRNEIIRDKLFGAVEVKAVGKRILNNGTKDQKQLIGHLLWFNKVIYTNGLEWRFYENKFDALSEDIVEIQEISFSKAFKYVEKKNKTEEYIKNENEEISKIEKKIDEFLNQYCTEKLECNKFILCKEENGKRVWDNREWKKLIKYLNKYNFII